MSTTDSQAQENISLILGRFMKTFVEDKSTKNGCK